MSDARRTFCPEDGRACYTPKGPEPEGFRCANYELCKSFERPANPPLERTDPVERFMAAIGSEAMQQPGEGLVFSYGQVERGIRAALQSSVVTEGEIETGLEAILAKSDIEIMCEELFVLFGRSDPGDTFSREEILKAMAYSFEQGKNHILMMNEALAMSAKAMGGE